MSAPDGSGARQLTFNTVWDGEAHWSPDGRRIVFTSERDSNPGWPIRRPEIHVMNADGSNVRKLTNSPEGSSTPRWSPDGTRIAFSRRGDDPRVRIYIMNADGTNVRALTPPEGGDFSPDWAPDGTKLLYITNQPPLFRWRLHIINVDGTGMHALGGDELCDGDITAARWSPYGTRIVYDCLAPDRAVHTMRADGTEMDRLSPPSTRYEPVWDWAPVWSPDGAQIAFSGWRNSGYTDVYVMNVNGGNVAQVTSDTATDEVSDWKRPR